MFEQGADQAAGLREWFARGGAEQRIATFHGEASPEALPELYAAIKLACRREPFDEVIVNWRAGADAALRRRCEVNLARTLDSFLGIGVRFAPASEPIRWQPAQGPALA